MNAAVQGRDAIEQNTSSCGILLEMYEVRWDMTDRAGSYCTAKNLVAVSSLCESTVNLATHTVDMRKD
jgi:hypothetical protein